MLVLAIVSVLVLLSGSDSAPLEYSDMKFDDVDLIKILNNEELYLKLFHCLVGHGKCTPDWELLKEALPNALLDNCDKCTGKQKFGTRALLTHLVHNKPGDMRLLEGEYDPDGSYRMEVEKEEKQSNDINRKRSASLENSEVEILHVRRVIK